jgi:hypothetical protein
MSKVWIMLISIFTLVGCGGNQEKKDYLALVQTTNPSPTTLTSDSKTVSAEEIEKEVEKFKDIYDVAVIKGDKEDLVVYKVKHLRRFYMKNIEKEVTNKLEDTFPDENFVVSSDYKIFLEAVRLNKKRQDQNLSKEEAQKKLDEIIKLKKELT